MWSHYSGSLTLTRAAQSQRGWDSNFEVENTKTQSQKIQKHIKKAQVSQVVMQEARMGFKLLKKRLGIQDVSIINKNKAIYHNVPNKVNISQLWNIQTLCIEFLEKTFTRVSIELIFHWQTLPGITYRVPQVTPVYFALFKIKMPTQKMLMLLLMLKGVLTQLVWL